MCYTEMETKKGANKMVDSNFQNFYFEKDKVWCFGSFPKIAATVSLAIVGLGMLAPAISASAAGATNTSAAPQTQIESNIANEMKGSNEEKRTENVKTESQKCSSSEEGASANLIFDENLSQLDLLEGDNLNKALQGAVSALLNLTAEDNVGGKYDYFKDVLSNAEVIHTLTNIDECLKDDSLSDTEKQVKLISHLKTLKAALERANLTDNLLYSFADSMGNEYKVIISRQVADEVIEKNRAEIEKKMGSESASFSASASTNVNVEGVDIGIGFGVNFKENSSETSFYQTSTGFSVDLSTGLGAIGIASLDVGTKVEVTRALVYQSLEQFLDTSCFSEGKVSTLRLRVPSIKEAAETREQMQKHEQKAILTLKTSVEPLLKILGIISQRTSLNLPNVTKTQSATREKTVKGSVGVEAKLKADTGVLKALADAGFEVSGELEAGKSVSSTSVRHSFIELIGDDCSAGFGVNADELTSYLKTNDYKKVNEIKSLLQDPTESTVVLLAQTVAHDLHDYNHCLSVISNETASEEDRTLAKSKKKEMEKSWLATLHKGRLNMLKTGISIATTLKEHDYSAESNEAQKAFKNLHTELDNLSKMQFSTKSLRSSKRSAEFATTHTSTATEFGFGGKVSLSIPGAEEAGINISSKNVKSQFDEHSTNDLTVEVKLPVVGNNIVGQKVLNKTIAKVQDKLIKTGNEYAIDIANGLKLLKNQFGLTSNTVGYALNKVSSPKNVKSYVTISFCFTKLQGNNGYSALPGQKLVERPKAGWALKYIKSAESKAVGVSSAIDEVNIKASAAITRATSVIGSDSLEFSANKFNVFAQTMNDSKHKKDISPLWLSFKSGQESQFKKIFKNMAQSGSNVRYELQGLYNEILQESGNSNAVKRAVDSAFKDFLETCGNFANDSSDENFEKASTAFDKVLKMNFEHNFMAGYNALHGTLKNNETLVKTTAR